MTLLEVLKIRYRKRHIKLIQCCDDNRGNVICQMSKTKHVFECTKDCIQRNKIYFNEEIHIMKINK